MKKLSTIIVILGLALGAYSVLWNHKTNEFKDEVEKSLVEINQNPKALHYKYDAIEKAGFPFGAEVVLKNPSLIAKDGQVLATHTGPVTIGSSLFEHEKIWVKTNGITKIFDNKEEKYKIEGATTLKCDHCGGENIRRIYEQAVLSQQDVQEWMGLLLRNVSIELSDFTIAEATQSTFDNIVSVKKGNIAFKNDEKDKFHNFSIDLSLDELVTNADSESIKTYQTLFPKVSKDDLRKIFDMGTSDVVFKAHGSLPFFDHPFYTKPSLLEAPSLMSFVIDKSDVKSTLYTSDTDGRFEFEKLPERGFKSILAFDQNFKATDKLQAKIIEIIKILTQGQALADKSATLVPNFTEFGTIEAKLDSHILGKQGASPNSVDEFTYEINLFKLMSALYGVEIKADVNQKEAKAPIVNLGVNVKNYRELFKDMLNYYNKWQTVMVETKAATQEQMPIMSEAFIDHFIQFFESLSVTKDTKNLDIPLVYNEKGITIGNKNSNEVLEAFVKLWSELNQPK